MLALCCPSRSVVQQEKRCQSERVPACTWVECGVGACSRSSKRELLLQRQGASWLQDSWFGVSKPLFALSVSAW